MNSIVEKAKEEIETFERPSVRTSKEMINEILRLEKRLTLAENVINKVIPSDANQRQMLSSYKIFTQKESPSEHETPEQPHA